MLTHGGTPVYHNRRVKLLLCVPESEPVRHWRQDTASQSGVAANDSDVADILTQPTNGNGPT